MNVWLIAADCRDGLAGKCDGDAGVRMALAVAEGWRELVEFQFDSLFEGHTFLSSLRHEGEILIGKRLIEVDERELALAVDSGRRGSVRTGATRLLPGSSRLRYLYARRIVL